MHNDYYYFGTIFKTKGYDGALILSIDSDETEKYKTLTELYVDFNNELQKHEIETIEINKNKTCNIVFKHINTLELAKNFQNKKVYLPLSLLPDIGDKRFYFHEIPGFTVIDWEQGNIGIAKEVIEYPQQNLLLVKNGFNELLIPLWENVVQLVDRKEKILHVKTPPGIIQSYLKDEEE